MIYQDTLCALKEDLMGTGYFHHLFEFATMEETEHDGKPVFKPVYFKDGGNIQDVMDFDRNGSGYIRKNGKINITKASNNLVGVSCDAKLGILELKLPLKGVFAVPKTKLGNDTYSTDKLALQLMGFFHSDVSASNGLAGVSRIVGYETERQKIYDGETNIGIAPILELAYISIDFEITYTGKAECFLETCAYYG